MGSTVSIVIVNDDSNMSVNRSLPFQKDGVKLSYIKEFYDACGGRDKLVGLTTTQVNDIYQKPMTVSSQLSFCEFLKRTNHPEYGIATIFISHAWKYLFLDGS